MCPSQDVFQNYVYLKIKGCCKICRANKNSFSAIFLSSQYLMHTSALNICKKQLSFYLIRLSPRCRLFSVLSSLLHIFSRYIHTIVAQMHSQVVSGDSPIQSDIFCFQFFHFFLLQHTIPKVHILSQKFIQMKKLHFWFNYET